MSCDGGSGGGGIRDGRPRVIRRARMKRAVRGNDESL